MEEHEASTGGQMGSQPSARSIFGEDGKLSSASAAASLKYAKPQDLPSFPSAGLKMSSAGAAASLASSNRKSFEHWKSGPIPAANKAALLAKDYEMEPLWQPQASAAGSKAAMMASKKNAGTEESDEPPIVSAEIHNKAMMAATSASHNRRRSGSMPNPPVSKSTKDSQWALKAATQSHKAGVPQISPPFASGHPGFEAARIQNVAKNNVDRQLYTASPPVAIEVQEKNRQDMLKASAIAMAQKMYAIQQRQFAEAAAANKSEGHALAASRSRARASTIGSASASDEVTSYVGGGFGDLEEAARKLAQERLAKIHDEHAEYRNYYVQQPSPPQRNRYSRRGRNRAASNENADDSDEEDSRRIKSQMSIFQSKLAEVDSKKRQQDRDNLLQIAHRNVENRIRKMDDDVFQDTGKASPAQMEQWQKSAREKAQKDSDERMQYAGKVHIGGGKYLEQSELDAIARARLQPTLDEISEKAERMRAKDEADRLERERIAKEAEAEKTRQAVAASEAKRERDQLKREEKAKRDEEKRVLKEQQAAEKAKRDEEKRVLREQQAAEKAKRDEENRVLREQQAAEKAKRDEENRVLKEQQTAEKEKRREEERRVKEQQNAETEKRRSKDAKPSRFSTLFGFGGGAATGAAAGVTAAETAGATVIPPSETFRRASAVGQTPYEELPEGQTVHDQVTSPTSPDQVTQIVSSSMHDQVTSPTSPDQVTEIVSSSTHDQVTSPVVHDEATASTTEEQAPSPTAHTETTTTTTTTTTAVIPEASVASPADTKAVSTAADTPGAIVIPPSDTFRRVSLGGTARTTASETSAGTAGVTAADKTGAIVIPPSDTFRRASAAATEPSVASPADTHFTPTATDIPGAIIIPPSDTFRRVSVGGTARNTAADTSEVTAADKPEVSTGDTPGAIIIPPSDTFRRASAVATEPTVASPADTQVTSTAADKSGAIVIPPSDTFRRASVGVTEPSRTSVETEKPAEKKETLKDDKKIASPPPTSPTKSSSSRVKSWMKGKFGSRSSAQKAETPSSSIQKTSTGGSGISRESNDAGLRANSMHDVAMAGKAKTNETEDMYGADKEVSPARGTANVDKGRRSSSISSMSSDYSGNERGRQGFSERAKKSEPGHFGSGAEPAEPVVSNTEDEFEEARDTFEEAKSAPSQSLSQPTEHGTNALSPKSSKEGSRFTEDI